MSELILIHSPGTFRPIPPLGEVDNPIYERVKAVGDFIRFVNDAAKPAKFTVEIRVLTNRPWLFSDGRLSPKPATWSGIFDNPTDLYRALTSELWTPEPRDWKWREGVDEPDLVHYPTGYYVCPNPPDFSKSFEKMVNGQPVRFPIEITNQLQAVTKRSSHSGLSAEHILRRTVLMIDIDAVK